MRRKFPKHIHIRIQPHQWAVAGVFVLVVLAIGFVALQGYKLSTALSAQLDVLSMQIDALSTRVDSRMVSLEAGFKSTTTILEEDIAQTSDALAKEKQNVSAIEQQLGSFEDEVGEISGTVSTLEKLSKTDPELLQKYSKVFFLNEHYEPVRLVEIPEKYKYSERKSLSIHSEVWSYLENMLFKAAQANKEIYVFSAFRSFDTQESLKGQYTVTYGEGSANQFSADQGYSEHQLGTTVDLITTGIDGTLSGFEKTDDYMWLLENAHNYGFTLSYPENNAFYIFEPWHWRFVGVDLARNLHNTNKHFYDLDQREIDEYLVSLFD